eukprot:scaffold100728_cov35-Tisochrysis_lutea.AAC.2
MAPHDAPLLVPLHDVPLFSTIRRGHSSMMWGNNLIVALGSDDDRESNVRTLLGYLLPPPHPCGRRPNAELSMRAGALNAHRTARAHLGFRLSRCSTLKHTPGRLGTATPLEMARQCT